MLYKLRKNSTIISAIDCNLPGTFEILFLTIKEKEKISTYGYLISPEHRDILIGKKENLFLHSFNMLSNQPVLAIR